MSATNEGLVWKYENERFNAESNGFEYSISVSVKDFTWYSLRLYFGDTSLLEDSDFSEVDKAKSYAQDHADAIQSAILKHRLDAERLAKALEAYLQAGFKEARRKASVKAKEALAAHREVLK